MIWKRRQMMRSAAYLYLAQSNWIRNFFKNSSGTAFMLWLTESQCVKKSRRLKIARSPVQARDCPLEETPGNSGGFCVFWLSSSVPHLRKIPHYSPTIFSRLCHLVFYMRCQNPCKPREKSLAQLMQLA
jgi:hypothetical protein